MLDERLKTIEQMVSGRGVAVDVGTDHAHLAAQLVKSGRCQRVIASDIKEGPLESARRTVEAAGISDKVELILSDGLENVPLEGVTDIVIAGMGGETIAEIIGALPAARYDQENVRWILQPMTKPEHLRKTLYRYQLSITEEKAVEVGDKIYVVMCAEYDPEFRYLTEFEALYGFFDDTDETAQKYREREAERLNRVAESLKKAGKNEEAQHYFALSYKMKNGVEEIAIQELYDFLDSLYPFALQEKWDNSGLLVENTTMTCCRVLLSLDISLQAVSEAEGKGSDLIISHHPVIFEPRRRISRHDPVYRLIYSDIAALCMHTNVDIAPGGTNGVILKKLSERFELDGDPMPFEELGGMRCVSRIAFCSGSGGSMLELAIDKGCDALITGDVKHDVWIDANNSHIALIDCGHFHTENPVLWELRRVIEEKFPQLDVEIAELSIDPCRYV